MLVQPLSSCYLIPNLIGEFHLFFDRSIFQDWTSFLKSSILDFLILANFSKIELSIVPFWQYPKHILPHLLVVTIHQVFLF